MLNINAYARCEKYKIQTKPFTMLYLSALPNILSEYCGCDKII